MILKSLMNMQKNLNYNNCTLAKNITPPCSNSNVNSANTIKHVVFKPPVINDFIVPEEERIILNDIANVSHAV